MIPEKLILNVFDRSWRGPWDRFGVILHALWGPLVSLGAFWRRFGCLLRSCGGPKGALARSWVSLGRSEDVLGGVFSVLEGSWGCLLYTSPSPRDATLSRMPSSA